MAASLRGIAGDDDLASALPRQGSEVQGGEPVRGPSG